MRRFAIVVLAGALVAAACGDDDASDSVFSPPASTATTSPVTTSPTEDGYPDAVVDEYMTGCMTESTEELCRCTIEQFEQRLSLSEFIELNESDLDSSPVVQDVISICLKQGTGATPTTSATPATQPEFSAIEDMDTVAGLTIADLEQWWATELPDVFGVEYEPVSAYGPYFPSEGDIPECGGPLRRDEFESNAFYCGIDDTVQWDAENLMAPLFQEFGDFTVALVLAHEWGHAVQNRFGFDDVNQPTIVSELQADCFAGAWTGRIAGEESDLLRLEPGDLEEGMSGFLLIGDQLGTDPGDITAHGGAFDRLTAFFDGFNSGSTRCATYEDNSPEIAFIPLRPEDHPVEGGDLPLAKTAPLLGDALEAFWAQEYPALFGEPWVPVLDRIPYLPSTGNLPACGGVTLGAPFYENNAFYCPDDDYVAWDNEGLFPSLYVEIGDFAIGLVLANEWGRAVQQRAGLPVDTPAAQLQVDCLTGAWTAALVPEDNPTGIILSAGDLEEGIAGFLQLSATPGEEGAVSAIDRFESFRDGFFEGTSACGI